MKTIKYLVFCALVLFTVSCTNELENVQTEVLSESPESSLTDTTDILKRQKRHNNLVSEKGISIYINNNFSNHDMIQTAFENAIESYNNLRSSIVFVLTTNSDADICITKDNTLGDIFGQARYPEDGHPGEWIKINEEAICRWFNRYGGTPEVRHFQHVIMHEIGHNIGLCHTNVNEPGTYIPGTPDGDQYSIMNTKDLFSFRDQFSEGDKLAIYTLYPPDVKCAYDLNHPSDAAIALDYNGNGFDDLLFYRPGLKTVFLNHSENNGIFFTEMQSHNGLGTFDFQVSADKAISLDYNGDGKDDVFCYRPGSRIAYLLKSNGDKTFTTIIGSSTGFCGYDFASSNDKAIALDYNGDGYDDIMCYRPGSRIVYLFKSNGNGSFTIEKGSSTGIGGFDFACTIDKAIALDYNGDGKDDIMCYRPGSKIVYILRSFGGGAFTRVYSSALGIAGYDFNSTNDNAIALDYNGDGYDDIMCYRPGSKAVFLLKSNGTTTFSIIINSANGIAGFDFSSTNDKAIALDYNNDGLGDIVMYRPGNELNGVSGIAWSAHSNGTSFVRDYPE